MNDASQPEKLALTSLDIAAEKRTELLRLFPEARTEGGKIDFERLKGALGEAIDAGRERYGLVWPGKADCLKTIQAPSLGTLRPIPDEGVNPETTENLIIEGDNLEVLKLLQKSYLGKIKLIYIDPPYNTGKDFIYPDNFSENLQTYLEYTGQVDAAGRKFTTNPDSDGRFHSKWLNMMYPRVYLARNLLRDDGVMMISIDDAEVENLRRICGEIFGEENLVATMIWEKSRKNDAKFVSVGHEYLLVYARSVETLKEMKIVWREEKPGAKEIWEEYLRLRRVHKSDDRAIEVAIQNWYRDLPRNHPSKKWSRYKRIDANGPWRDRDISWPGGDGPTYDVVHPVTGKPCKVPEAGWRYANPEEMQRQIQLGLVEFREDHSEPPFRKAHIRPVPDELDDLAGDDADEGADETTDEELATQVRGSYFYKQSQVAVKYLKSLMGAKLFDNPKDHEELSKLFKYVLGAGHSEIVLDFFGGSGSTAEAVMQLNVAEGTSHKFVVVQLPEPCNPKERTGRAALRAGIQTVADIAKERVRRAAKRLASMGSDQLALAEGKTADMGFRVFRLAESNFTTWGADESKTPEQLKKQLDLHVDHVRTGRSDDDILCEILLKSGFPLATPVAKTKLAGTSAFSIAGGALIVCLERNLTLELIRAIADLKPERVVCLDEGFAGNDQLKTNAVQTFRAKGVASFRTV